MNKKIKKVKKIKTKKKYKPPQVTNLNDSLIGQSCSSGVTPVTPICIAGGAPS